MRNLLTTILCSIFVLASASRAPLRAQVGGGCPDQRASFVPGAQTTLEPWRTCYLMVHVLGIVIAIPHGRCPTGHTYVPDHEECLGEFAPGMRCEELACIPIQLELCRCVPHVGSWYSYSTCECHAVGAMGFVMQGVTVECH